MRTSNGRLLGAALVAIALTTMASASSAKPDEASARALVLFDRGKIAYKEGRFDESVLLLKEAYAIKAEPILLYNIARAHEAKGQFPEAVEAYKKYLATATDPPDRAEVEAKIVTLEKAIADDKSKADAAAQAEADRKAREEQERAASAKPAPAEPGNGPNLVPWVVAGSGAVILGVGAVFGVLALGKNSDADEATSQADAVDQQDGAETLALVSTISFVVGGAVLAGGATWGIINLTSGPSSAESGRLELRLRGNGAAIHGDF